MIHRRFRAAAAGGLLLLLSGCGDQETTAAEKVEPAKIETRKVGEADLTRLVLTAKAVERLGIKTELIQQVSIASSYDVAGEAVVPPGQLFVVSAPTSGAIAAGPEPLVPGARVEAGKTLLRIKPLLSIPRDLKVNAEAELRAAEARVEAAKQRTARAQQMLDDRVGSERALQDAQEAELVALTALEAASLKLEQIETAPVEADVEVSVVSPESGILQQVHAAPGQMVSGGAPLLQVARLDPIWVRAPVYSGDVRTLNLSAPARVRPLNALPSERGRTARPAPAPPSADPLASTSDVFYSLPNASGALRPGERVSLAIPNRSKSDCLQVPWAAVLYDVNGGAWVYEQVEATAFVRRRVAVERVVGDAACIASGPLTGTKLVTAGAAELFGTEFGGGK